MRLCRRLVLAMAGLGDEEDGEEFGRLLGEVDGVAKPAPEWKRRRGGRIETAGGD